MPPGIREGAQRIQARTLGQWTAGQVALAMDGLNLNDTAITILNNIMEKPQSVPSGTDPGGKRNAKNGLHNPC